MGKLLNDEGFKHIHYNATDLHKTFARVRKQQAEEAASRKAKDEAVSIKQQVKVHVLKGAK